MGRRGTMCCLRAIAMGIVVTWGARASAEPTYLGYLQSALLPSTTIVNQPYSCAPCHLTDLGGSSENPNLAPFGDLLHEDGIATSSSETQFASVLGDIKQAEPKVYADLQNGRDPNPDVTTSGVHIPDYGCDLAAPTKTARPWWWASSFGALAALALRRRTREGHRPKAATIH
jgi:hypothetical protein